MYGKNSSQTVKDDCRYILRAEAERASDWNVKKKKGKRDGNADRGVTDDETKRKKVDGEKERAEGRKRWWQKVEKAVIVNLRNKAAIRAETIQGKSCKHF